MAAEKIQQLQLLPFQKILNKFYQQNSFLQKEFVLTRKNPFKTMSDAEWQTYVETHEPHFTSEPYYEVIPWKELQQLEINAKAAGWELILRTTNNTAYCPGHVGQSWCQRTQWFFGIPNMQLMIHLTYNEDKWSLTKEENNDMPMKNYFHLNVNATTKLKVREKTIDDYDDDYYDYDYSSNTYTYYDNYQRNSDNVEYYDAIKPAKGWVANGGMMDNGTSQFEYIFVGHKAAYNNFLDMFISATIIFDDNKNEEEDDNKETNIMDSMFKPTFWTEWIEQNKDNIQPGKFNILQITHWGDTYVLPGGQFNIDDILKWDMDFRFLQKLMKSNIRNWITRIFGGECCGSIRYDFWNNMDLFNSIIDNQELFKKTCIIEAKTTVDDEWKPFDGYKDSLLQQESIRLSENTTTLIKQMWQYVNQQN